MLLSNCEICLNAKRAMTGGGYVGGIRQVFDPFMEANLEEVENAYKRWLPHINPENRQGSFATAKILMKEGGIIHHDGLRAPLPPVSAEIRSEILEMAKQLDVLALRWTS